MSLISESFGAAAGNATRIDLRLPWPFARPQLNIVPALPTDLHNWVLIDTEVRAGTAGYLSQTSVLYGADGHAYSVSHQTVAVFG